MKWTGVFIVYGFIASCVSEPSPELKSYFDLPSFFSEEVKTLANDQTRLKKIIRFNGREEEMLIDTADWKTELQLFLDCDLNTPAYRNGFSVDTVYESPEFLQLTYIAVDKNSFIRKVEIKFQNKQVNRVRIVKSKSNLYLATLQILDYYPHKRYSMVLNEKQILQNTRNISITGIILNR